MGDPDERPSSSFTRRDALISIRVTRVQKRRLEDAARRARHPSLSSYALDRLTGAETQVTERQRRILIGHLGQLGAGLTGLAARAGALSHPEIAASLERAASDVVALQQAIMR